MPKEPPKEMKQKLWQKKLPLEAKIDLGLHNLSPLFGMELIKKGKLFKYKRFYQFYQDFVVCYKSEQKARENVLNMKSILFVDSSIQVEWVFKSVPSSEFFNEPFIHQISEKKSLSLIKLENLESQTLLIPPDNAEKLEVLREYFRKRFAFSHYYKNYKELQELGKGKYSTVFLSRSLENFKTFAVKMINKEKERLSEREFNLIKNEIKILSFLKHPNVVELREVYQSYNTIQIVLEHLRGKSLQSLVKSGRKFSHKEAASIMKGLLTALQYLKTQNIIHRDLKPDNILFKSEEISEESVCIVDFGFSTYLNHPGFLAIKCGTPGFVAPEVLMGRRNEPIPFTPACDMFALGIIFHILLFGKSPFRASNYKEMINMNKDCTIDYESSLYYGVPRKALELLKALLEKDPIKRISVEEALEHSFFVQFSRESLSVKEKIITNQSSMNSTAVLNNNISSDDLNPERANPNCAQVKEGSSPPEAILSLTENLLLS